LNKLIAIAAILSFTLLACAIQAQPEHAQRYSVGCSSLAKPAADTVDWWPVFRHDSAHSGCSSVSAPLTNETLWKFKVGVTLGKINQSGSPYATAQTELFSSLNVTYGGSVSSSPAVIGGVVYVGASDGNLYALNASTGALIWNYTTGFWINSSPAVADGKVYIGSWDKNLYAFNASTGMLLWNYTTGGAIESSPAVDNGIVFTGSDDGHVYALNGSTGVFLWNYATGAAVESSPAVSEGRVYVGTWAWDDKVYALNASTGALLWYYTTGFWINSSPAVADGRVYIGSMDYDIYALNASTGMVLWNYATGFWINSSPAVADGTVYIGSVDGNVYALNATNGALVWSRWVSSVGQSSAAVADGMVFTGASEGLYALNASTGVLVWNYSMGAEVASSPAVVGGNLYVGSEDGNIYAFGPSSNAYNFPVLFTESGLAEDTQWFVSFNGETQNSTLASIVFNVPNGVYEYYVTPPSGYNTSQLTGSVTVNGSGVNIQITFTLLIDESPSLFASAFLTTAGLMLAITLRKRGRPRNKF
jgi:outer membrane protein assembly factor BamB